MCDLIRRTVHLFIELSGCLCTELLTLCCRFLVNTSKDCDLRKWATEGLAYLTLDAEVKEELMNDTPALKSIFELAKVIVIIIIMILFIGR